MRQVSNLSATEAEASLDPASLIETLLRGIQAKAALRITHS